MKNFFNENVLYIALVQAVIATLGSLYFSEFQHFTPCILCWYQRICMYPLVVILFAGIMHQNRKIHWYVLPLSLIGMGIALYHNLLYYKIIPEVIAPCQAGISCTTKFIAWFGFITIPFLSFLGFLLINVSMIFFILSHKKNTHA